LLGGFYFVSSNPSQSNKIIEQKQAPLTLNIQKSVIDLKPGDMSGDMRVLSVEPYSKEFGPIASNNVTAKFEGTTIIEGKYEYSFSGFDGSWSLVFTESTSSKGLPLVIERNPRFHFLNQETALKLLKLTPQTAAHGVARIKVQNYSLNSYPSEVVDQSTILSVEE
jgi:hypothetical protein